MSKNWRERIIYTVMSAFVAFQTLVIVVTPSPDSELGDWLRGLAQPYLTLFRLDNQWDFFAPNVGLGVKLRYDLELENGERRIIFPTDQLSWFHPNFFWFRAWFYRIMDYPDDHAENATAYFCKKNAALKPKAITYFQVEEELFTREDFLNDQKRTRPDFITVTPIGRFECPAE